MSDAVVVLSSPSDSDNDGGGDGDGEGTARRAHPGVVRPGTPQRGGRPARSARVDELFATQMLSAAHKDDVVVIDDDDDDDENERDEGAVKAGSSSSGGGDSQATQDPREEEDEDEEVPETPGDAVLVADSEDDADDGGRGEKTPRTTGGSLAERLRRATVAEAHRQQAQQAQSQRDDDDDDDDLLADTQDRGARRLPARPYDAFYRPSGAAPDAFAQLTGYRSSSTPRRTVTRTPPAAAAMATATTGTMTVPRVALARPGRGDECAARERELGMLSAEQRAVLQHALAGDSFFFTGAAGTGKSFLLRCIIAALQAKLGAPHVFVTARFVSRSPHSLSVCLLACLCVSLEGAMGDCACSTGIAACNISGTTLHSFAAIKLGRGTKKEVLRHVMASREGCQRWRTCEVLVVDEVSMISGELFDKIEFVARAVRRCERPFGGIQVILCGDFFQLPPVFDADEHEHRYCFEADCWRAVVPQSFMLRQIFRQRDSTFIDVLSEVRTGNISPKTVACLQACIRAPWEPSEGNEPTRLCL